MVRKWWKQLSTDWPTLTIYQRFESVVALALTLLISLVILVALIRLFVRVVSGLVFGAMNPLDHMVFQNVFGEILTLLIALEFNHTLQYVATRQQTIIQTKVVVLIALLALARKFIVLDIDQIDPVTLLGLAAITLVLGLTYRLIWEPDTRTKAPQGPYR
ncbi:phosphate-starvation-inducible PsiE family protein [Roseateles oligotrophus]|uniref:Phosphate-starvation-inducible PsiE family protein n=1 Tax=Roseateles oligotrophus TaxID=1769250 RepID=A0ABT2Y976_9BURK|nr:phosphate-starvation-inducible PsiE family protein [Roseateles oligotrophus]MCV2366600.1 phosphate-starvation-inducible PsiE family protein [Roseateles oligotrophus]